MLLRAVNDDHYHIAYIRPDGSGSTSTAKGHTHEIASDIQPNENLVPGTQPAPQPSILPGGKDGHTHQLQEIYQAEVKEQVLDDEEELKACLALYQEAKRLNEASLNEGKEDEDFYQGKQWDENDKTALKSESRACLTINELKPKLDMLSGHQRQNRTDIKLLSTERGDQLTADMYNLRIKNIWQQNNADYEETRTFEDQSRVGMGAWKVDIMASTEGIGEVKIENKYWETVMFGPHTKMDGADAEYVVSIDQISKAKLKELYPEKADEIEKDFTQIATDRKIPISRADKYTHKGDNVDLTDTALTKQEPDLVDIAKQSYRLIEIQRKVYKRTPVLFNAKHNFYFNAEGMDKKDFESAKSLEEINSINHVSDTIRITVFAGNTLLRTEKSLFSRINIVPAYANKIKNYWWGKVRDAKDPQKELNKRHSQSIDIINKMASYGMGVTAEAFESPKDYEDFKKNRNKPGFLAKFKPGFQTQIYEFQGVKYPSEVVAMSQLSSQQIEVILNIHPAMMGQGGMSESGTALAQKQRAGLVGNEYLFDNFSLSKRRIAKLIIEAIQIVDSPEKLIRIAETQNNNTLKDTDPVELYPKLSPEEVLQMGIQTGAVPQEIPMMLQQMQNLPPEQQQQIQQQVQQLIQKIAPMMQKMANEKRRGEMLKLLENFEISKYDLVVSESAFSPTTRFANFVLLKEMFGNSPNMPLAQLIDLNPFLDQKTKDSITGAMQQQAQAAKEAEDRKYDTEIKKTLIAKQQPQVGEPA